MSWPSIVLICVLAALFGAAIFKYIKDAKSGKCSGGCSSCSKKNCSIRKDESGSDDKKE